jgi:hypothetical protein
LAQAGDRGGSRWGSAEEVPGTAKLNAGGRAEVLWLSCPSAGNCAAGGFYADESGDPQAFVVDEVGGRWGRAQEVPGTAKLNSGGRAEVLSLSCASAGNCAAGGAYQFSPNGQRAFVVDEVGGRWGRAQEVPGTAKLNAGGRAEVLSLSCASTGNCAAGGLYRTRPGFPGHLQAFVVDEVGGRWRLAREVPGTAKLNAFGDAEVNSLSCTSAGDCTAGGFYTAGSGSHAFVVDEVAGTWRLARDVLGTAKLHARRIASVDSLWCASAGNCAAGGVYVDGSRQFQAFVVDEVGGRWGTAQEIPGTATLNRGDADVNSLSCASAGNCAAGGAYLDGSRHFQAFVVDEVGGRWGSAQEVPGTARLNAGGRAWVASMSCASASFCAAGGFYTDGSGNLGHQQAFVVDYRPAPTTVHFGGDLTG